jgi:predicted metal-binding membrane protein
MAASMAAMMLPTAAPFFVAYGRSSKRARATAIVVAIYVAVWAAIGLAAYLVMSQVMLPSEPWIAGVAVLLAALYTVAPWARSGRARCRQVCRELAGDPVRSGLAYAGGCVACSAGVMAAVVVLGMSNPALMAAAAAVVLLLKWPQRSTLRPGSLSPEGDLALSP